MNCKVGAQLRLSLLAGVPVWCAFIASGTAHAACSNNPPAMGQTVNCDATGGANGAVIAPAGVTDVTVNVLTGASVTGVAQTVPGATAQYSSVFVNDGSTVNNSGTISPTLPGVSTQRDYVGVNLNGSNTTFVNDGNVTVTNLATAPGSTTYRLYGVIASVPSTAPADTEFDNVSVVNKGFITITQAAPGGGAVARGVYAGENISSMSIDNFGTIAVTRNPAVAGTISSTAYAGIDSDDGVDDLKVTNRANAVVHATGVNAFAVGGRANTYTIINAGTITADGTTPRGAIVLYSGSDNDSPTAKIVNTSTGTITGNVIITDSNPLTAANTAPGSNVGTAATTAASVRDSTFNNKGTVTGGFTYGAGTHVLRNDGTITGPIFVLQAAAVAPAANIGGAALGIGGASFTLRNTGTLGGDITIRDRADSVNKISLEGTGFTGNVVAVNGTGSNSLSLLRVTDLASVQNFSNLILRQSNVTVTSGVSLVSGASIGTTIYGPGGTRDAPSTNLGTINGTLTLAGQTTVTPTFVSLARNGDVYQVASAVTGAGAAAVSVRQPSSALVTVSTDTTTGRLLLETQVRDPRTISGISQPAGATLQALLTYDGSNKQVYTLGGLVENLSTDAAVKAAGSALAPITDGAAVQTAINSTMLFSQQVDSRLDAFLYGQIPSSGRSADLGVPRALPVYGILPANGAWVEGIGGGSTQSTSSGVAGYNVALTGVVGGYDRLITPNLRIGGAFGYIDGRVNGNANGGTRQDVQTYQGLAYASYDLARLYVRATAGYGGVNFQSARQISFGAFSDVATGTHNGNVFTTRGEVGLPTEYLSNLLIPYGAFTYSRLAQDGYAETSGNGAAFNYGSASNNSERSEVGGKVLVPIGGAPIFSKLFPLGSAVAVEARAAYVHEFGNVAQTVAASFTGGGNVFIATGPTPDRDMVDYGVGLRMGSGPVQIDLSYNGLARSSYLQQVGVLRARYVF